MDSVAEASEHEITVLDTTVHVKAPSVRQLDVIRNRVFTETSAMEIKTQLILAGVTDVSTILDIGANIGCTSILYSLLFPLPEIIAIKPSEFNFEFPEYNTDEFSNSTLYVYILFRMDKEVVNFFHQSVEIAVWLVAHP